MPTDPGSAMPAFLPLSKDQLRREKPNRDAFRSMPRNPVRLVLDGVTQHHNIGAILRLADAMLVEEVIVCGTTVNPRNRKLVQAARGTQGWVPWSESPSAEAAVARAKAEGYRIVVAELTRNSVRPEELGPCRPTCLVLGGERTGVSASVAALADAAVAIPMMGMANSLNVATAAGIVLYHLVHGAECR